LKLKYRGKRPYTIVLNNVVQTLHPGDEIDLPLDHISTSKMRFFETEDERVDKEIRKDWKVKTR